MQYNFRSIGSLGTIVRDSYARKGVFKVIDGDTFKVEIDLGFFTKTTQELRLFDVNAFETKIGAKTTVEMKEKGKEAKRMLAELMDGKEFSFLSTGKDKYGRWISIVWLDENTTVQDWLFKNDFLTPQENV